MGIRGGSGFGGIQHFGTAFGSGLRQPAFRSGRSFGGFRGPVYGRGHYSRYPYLSTVSPYYFGYYSAPYYSDFYPMPDDYPAYDYYGSSYYSFQNDASAEQQAVQQQQADIDRLEDEVARLREQRESPEPSAALTPEAENQALASTPTLLVFRDKHTQEVQNYAIVGGTLWIFSEQRATKLPLAWLDIEATRRANEDRGVDFQLPQ